jgi:hypothetical protein
MTRKEKLENSKGEVFYGMHFYPGVAEYEEPGGEPFRIFINENTIRKMGPSFSGRPIFVEHVEEVDDDINSLRNEADGWVIESFFNAADGKTWAKFIVVSDRGLTAIRRGFKLSNAYVPKTFGNGGLWNGVAYQKEVTDGEFEHLAIVRNPRYEESVIMTSEQFKAYNDEKTVELKRLANSKDKKGDPEMKLNIFKRTKVENSIDLDGLVVELPKSKKEMSLVKVITDFDTILNMNGYANGDHMVKVGEKDEMSVNDLVKKHMELSNKMAEYEAKKNEGDEADDKDPAVENDDEAKIVEAGIDDLGDHGGDQSLANEEDDEEKKKKEDKEKMKNAKEKALRLKNAHLNAQDEEEAIISLPQDQVARGKARYGSGN